jgi:hypothetical protein
MAYDKFLIAPMDIGLERDVKPWLIQEKAFSELKNAYIFRGRVRKRTGSINTGTVLGDNSLESRLRVDLGNTDGSGNITGTAPGVTFEPGQMFSIGTEIFTVYQIGAPAVMLTTGSATTHTYNTTTGAYVINGAAAATACYFYPAQPVMGFLNYESLAINNEQTFAFDTQFSYIFSGGSWIREATGGAAALWSGSNSEFFSGTNYRGVTDDINILFVTNYNATDKMRYWNGTTWTAWNPDTITGGNDTVETARIILPFKKRLLLFNTKEIVGGAAKTFNNRVRWSQVGSPLDATAFLEPPGAYGKGSRITAPIKEAIVSATLFKDRCIVYFERSTWELVYTGNQVIPFEWQEINIELGCESTFSVVPFDKVILGIGENGIHACNGANVERIDTKIPDEVFELHNDNDGVFRVHGIRDYYAEMVYWSVPSDSYYSNSGFPNRILAFNYRNNTWAFFDDSITAFGNAYDTSNDITWANSAIEWQEFSGQWNDGSIESQFRSVIAGNQEGYVFIMEPDFTKNAVSLQITNITEAAGVVTLKIYNHNLISGSWITISDCEGITELNDNNYKVKFIDADTVTIDNAPTVTGTYAGAGTCSLLSRIDIKTKEFNFYSSRGSNTNIAKIDFYVDNTHNEGELTVDAIPSSSGISLRDDGFGTDTTLGFSILETTPYDTVSLESAQKRFWHAVYFQAQGETIQIRIYWSDNQMSTANVPLKDFQLNGLLFHTSQTQEL